MRIKLSKDNQYFFPHRFFLAISALAAKFIKNWMHWHSPLSKREQCIFRSGRRHFARDSCVCWYTVLFTLVFSSSSSFVSCKYLHALFFCRIQHIQRNVILCTFLGNGKNGTVPKMHSNSNTIHFNYKRDGTHTHYNRYAHWMKMRKYLLKFCECMHPTWGTKNWRGIICCNIKWNQLKLYIYIMKIIMRSTWLEWTMASSTTDPK